MSGRSATWAGPTSTRSARRRDRSSSRTRSTPAILENVNEGPDAERSIEQLVRTGHKLIYTTSFGFMDATAKVAKKYPERDVRARDRLQARQEPRDLFRPLLRRPLHQGADRRQDVEDRHDRLHRLVPDPGSRLRHQRHDARRAVGAPRHEGEDHLGEHLVRSRARKRPPRARSPTRARTSSRSTRIRRPRRSSPTSAASMRSGRTPT